MLKLGKLDFVADDRDLLFSNYRAAQALPKHPRTFGHDMLVKSWGMVGNDQWGDCAEAMIAHVIKMWCAEAGSEVNVNTKSVLDLYSKVTGFDPNDPNSDQGTMLRDLLKYMRDTGYVDGSGKVHKIAAFVKIDHTNLDQLEEAAWLFGAVMMGFQLPESAQNQFQDGQPWSVVRNSPIEGGHAVPLVGIRAKSAAGFLESALQTLGISSSVEARGITWGADIAIETGFIHKYADEAWAVLSEDELHAGKSLEGFDLEQLRADLRAL